MIYALTGFTRGARETAAQAGIELVDLREKELHTA